MAGRVETWKECAAWLTRCSVLRDDHKANWPDSVASDLAMTLRDGVVLCTLLIKFDSTCMDSEDVSQKPRMAQVLCLRNIKLFLQASRDSFGLKEGDLFEPQCLFDFTDFLRILQTLSKLSHTPKFQRKGISGFAFLKHRSLSQEDIYKNLSSSEGTTPRNIHGGPEEISSHLVHMRNEEIYQGLCEIAKVSSQTATAQPVEERELVIDELIRTEQSYVGVLSSLQENFMKPLSSFLREEDYNLIFSGIKDLHAFHTPFLASLQKSVAPGSKLRLSEVFLSWREKFLMYGDYFANLTAAQNRIKTLCRQNESFHTELERCERKRGKVTFTLNDLLAVPMQRMLKYHLLLGKLVDNTPMSHEDYRGLERAKEAAVDINNYLNEVVRDTDILLNLGFIEGIITDWVKPRGTHLHHYGRLNFDGEFRIKAHNDQKQKLRYVFVFDTVLVMCKAMKGEEYSFKEMLTLSEYELQENERKGFSRDARWSHQWFLVHRAEQTAYTWYAKNEDSKRKCMKAIRDALDNIEPKGFRIHHHRFRMHTYERPTTCIHCSKYLKGKIFQGYQCEKCRINCHKMCLEFCGRCGSMASNEPPLLPPKHPPITPPTLSPILLEQLQRYMWFVGEMGREKAARILDSKMNGTYLLRFRSQCPSHSSETPFALSLKADDRVKHMKIYEKVFDGAVSFYLSGSRFFKSVIDLVTYYEKNSLEENFSGLNVVLEWPLRQLVVVAEFDYTPTEPNQLPLRTGCQIIVLSKEGDGRGWWKGTYQNREGFFPKHYVREISDTLTLGVHDKI